MLVANAGTAARYLPSLLGTLASLVLGLFYSHNTGHATSLLFSLSSSLTKHLNLLRKPFPQGFRMERAIAGKPGRERRLDFFLLYNTPGSGLVLNMEFVERRMLLYRGSNRYL
jgi:hypothetical protein